MGQRIVRTALVAGAAVLALLLLLATCGGAGDGKGAKDDKGARPPAKSDRAAPPVPRLLVPSVYDTTKGWRIAGGSDEYALAQSPALVAHVERSGTESFVLRAYDARTGRPVWTGRPWRSLSGPRHFPRLLAVTKDDRRFFVTWSYGKDGGADALSTGDSVLALDVYDAKDGTQRHTELPWAGVPVVSGTGPGVLVTDGAARATVVDPLTLQPTSVAPQDLGYPKGCKNCRVRTEVRGLTAKGLLVGGRTEFWVRPVSAKAGGGGWYSAKVAPRGTDPASGLPTSLTASGHVLAKWRTKKADGRDRWAVHDANTGKVLATADCRRPAIEPGTYPQAATAPGGHYLVAGNLAFDLRTPAPRNTKTGHCLQERAGSKPVTLVSVTDAGLAYGTTSPTSAGGTPVEVPLATAVPAALADTALLPEAEVAGTGLFRWTDRREHSYLVGYPMR
jgi:hypothetical protein